MYIRTPSKIVLLGMMSRMPVAGVIWQTLHYLIGFQRLGYDVYYVEAHGCTPSAFMKSEHDDGAANAAAFIDAIMHRFDLGDHWAYHAPHTSDRCFGCERGRLEELYRSAALIINLHGGTVPLPEHSAGGKLVFLETDPVELQMELYHNRPEAITYLEPHAILFTFGENYGKAACRLPVPERFTFLPTRQPVVIDFWPKDVPANGAWTTIGNWRQDGRDIVFQGEIYRWSKHYEFLKFLDLPRRAHQNFELALSISSCSPADRQLLEENGWSVRDAGPLSGDVDAYRNYVVGSHGEFTVAKDQNVRLRTGWFSDRSATYLAAGRPVITQETGFSDNLPTGCGLFAFRTIEEIAAALDCIAGDYASHCRAAREIAAEYFAAENVLRNLLQQAGVSS